jgi:hypothetical protein
MAEEPARQRPHIYLPGQGDAQHYTAHQAGGGSSELPRRRGDTEIRYSLVVSLRAYQAVDLYTTIETLVTTEIPIET